METQNLIYLAITIDTECDKGERWLVKQPLQFSNIHQGVAKVLQPFFESLSVPPTYFLSPEVIDDQESIALFKDMPVKELGTHLHSEFIDPNGNKSTATTNTFQSDYPADMEAAKLQNLTTLFTRVFGYPPVSFRAGRFGLSPNTLGILEDLHYKVDSSVTPGLWWLRKGGQSVNFFSAPWHPYHPDKRHVCRQGHSRLVEVPVTIVNASLDRIPVFLRRRFNPAKKLQRRLLSKVLGHRIKMSWLRPTFSSAEGMLRITDYVQMKSPRRDTFLCLMFHSNEFTIDTSPYSLMAEQVNIFFERLSSYLAAIKKRGGCFCTLSQLVELI